MAGNKIDGRIRHLLMPGIKDLVFSACPLIIFSFASSLSLSLLCLPET
jgi:hypothetical protein